MSNRDKVLAQAKLGIAALIDEATGYQDVRPADELARRYDELGGETANYRSTQTEEGDA